MALFFESFEEILSEFLPQSENPKHETDESEGKKIKKRKHKGRKEDIFESISAVAKTKFELSKMTLENFESSVAQITSVRDLTSAEKDEVVRQRRLVKGRIFAQKKRNKNTTQIDELKAKILTLETDKLKLGQDMDRLARENAALRKEVASLLVVMNKTNVYF